MRSLQAFTKEVDDIDIAVSELKAGIDTSLFMKNTCGIIFCGFEPDGYSCAAEPPVRCGESHLSGLTGATLL